MFYCLQRNTNCSSSKAHHLVTRRYNFAEFIISLLLNYRLIVLFDRCNGKGYCVVEANPTYFGEPCAGVHKYLEVRYRCE